MGDAWPWLALALLGAYHGLNPAMGWLFAVALGMQERSRGAVVRALPAIAVGHEASVALVALLVVGTDALAGPAPLRAGAAGALVAFGIFRFARPRWHPRWVRGRVNGRELAVWSFLMSTAHGAGLMVAPVLLGGGAQARAASDHDLAHLANFGLLSPSSAALGTLVHVGAMVAVMAASALLVYERLGVRFLRRAWFNSDRIWAASFLAAGALTLFT